MSERLINNGRARENRIKNWDGIKAFAGQPLPSPDLIQQSVSAVTAKQLREEKKVWRPEETLEAAGIFFRSKRINIIGEPQSGKGTILFGLSEICDLFGWGYIFIDGHHQDAPVEVVLDVIRKANNQNKPIFFDSFDYLFVKGKKRIIPQNIQQERTTKIIDELDKATTPVAITHHDETWTQIFVNLEFQKQFARYLTKYPSYTIPLNFKHADSIIKFLTDHQVHSEDARFLTNMQKTLWVIDVLTHHFGDGTKVKTVFEAVKNYPVLKELARDKRREFDAAFDCIKERNEEEGIIQLARTILAAEYKRVFLVPIRKEPTKYE